MSDTDAPEAGTDAAAIARKELLAQDLARAKDAGWNDRMPFMYETVVGGTPAEDETREDAAWLSEAVVYEWDDEYGDVGEPNPELEKALYEGDQILRAGAHIKALSFNVDTEGPTKVHPVRNVSARVRPHFLSSH